jgi:hypothetical protein
VSILNRVVSAVAAVIAVAVASPSSIRAATPAFPSTGAGATPPDTLDLRIGSAEVDGRIFGPHRARNVVYIDGSPTPVSSWTNELVLGDSAGIPVMRWTSTSEPLKPGDVTWQLRQTYDARSLEPYGYWLTVSTGAETKLALKGNRIHGTRREADADEPALVDDSVERRGFFANASDLIPVAVGLRDGLVMKAPFWTPGDDPPAERVFSVHGQETVEVEGARVLAWKVDEHDVASGRLLATWYLTESSPFMVLAEIELPDGRRQRITGVALDDRGSGPSEAPGAAPAQASPEADIRATIDRVFTGMHTADSAMVRSAHAPGARFVMLAGEGAAREIRVMEIDGWLGAIARSGGSWEERIFDVEISVDDFLASVWAPYPSSVNGVAHHCGTNAIELLRTPAGWTTTQISDTQRPDGCPGG